MFWVRRALVQQRRWVTDAETGKPFCIWLPAGAADVPLGVAEEAPSRESKDQALH